MFAIIISIISGSIIVISRILNTRLSEKVGLLESSFYNYLTGLLSALILFAFIKDSFTSSQLASIPIWAYLGGAIGIIIVISSSVVTPKMSSFYITLIIFIGQLFSGIIIDCLTLKTMPLQKIVGGLLVVLGLGYNLYIDSEKNEIIVTD
ncbi:DMT family transporter [Clostridium sp. C2-6-12]|uniref:DMT family transporter n=1 Tax=Clostridium sp. C2-6-12 TaxID=2698832 RepID=UPI0013717F2B|nr:DMT family transporter [Clostridium sp. C2-6-12]